MNKSTGKREKRQESRDLENQCWVFLKPFLEELHKTVDRRLVKTLLDLVLVMLMVLFPLLVVLLSFLLLLLVLTLLPSVSLSYLRLTRLCRRSMKLVVKPLS